MTLRELVRGLAAQQHSPNAQLVEQLTEVALECRRTGYVPSLYDLQRLEDFEAWKRAGQLYDLERATRYAMAASASPVEQAQARADLDGGQSALDALARSVCAAAAADEVNRAR